MTIMIRSGGSSCRRDSRSAIGRADRVANWQRAPEQLGTLAGQTFNLAERPMALLATARRPRDHRLHTPLTQHLGQAVLRLVPSAAHEASTWLGASAGFRGTPEWKWSARSA